MASSNMRRAHALAAAPAARDAAPAGRAFTPCLNTSQLYFFVSNEAKNVLSCTRLDCKSL